jgi:hypothetical protein
MTGAVGTPTGVTGFDGGERAPLPLLLTLLI